MDCINLLYKEAGFFGQAKDRVTRFFNRNLEEQKRQLWEKQKRQQERILNELRTRNGNLNGSYGSFRNRNAYWQKKHEERILNEFRTRNGNLNRSYGSLRNEHNNL